MKVCRDGHGGGEGGGEGGEGEGEGGADVHPQEVERGGNVELGR